jgi:DnaJ-class molecular chaperone
MKTSFETEVCSRCHGSGKYSFCETYRDRCFKCAGDGKVLSKRGYAAQKHFIESCSVPLSDLKVGDRIRVGSMTHSGNHFTFISTITEISRSETPSFYSNGTESKEYYPLTVVTEHPKHGKCGLTAPDHHTVRVYREGDDERLIKALKYQETLTKSGIPRKTTKIA